MCVENPKRQTGTETRFTRIACCDSVQHEPIMLNTSKQCEYLSFALTVHWLPTNGIPMVLMMTATPCPYKCPRDRTCGCIYCNRNPCRAFTSPYTHPAKAQLSYTQNCSSTLHSVYCRIDCIFDGPIHASVSGQYKFIESLNSTHNDQRDHCATTSEQYLHDR